MDIEIDTYEFVKDQNGGRFKRGKEVKHFTESEVRHKDICTLCGFSTYPECRKWCDNGK